MIDDTQKMIRKNATGFSIDAIPTDDPAVYAMLTAGETEGIFQFESTGMRNVIMQLRPEYMEDLIAVISLYRPPALWNRFPVISPIGIMLAK